jgi:hypothetical protein
MVECLPSKREGLKTPVLPKETKKMQTNLL